MYISSKERAIPPQFDYGAFELPRNVSLTMAFNPHNGPEDLPDERKLTEEIKDVDGLIIEMATESDAMPWLNKISMGDHKTYLRWRSYLGEGEQTFGTWGNHMIAALYGTRTPATTVDVHALDRSLRQTTQAMRAYDKQIVDARTNADIVAAKPLTDDIYTAFRVRDQKILANFSPRIEALSQKDKNLGRTRLTEPAEMSVFYGTVHRSLLDALVAKNRIAPAEGFNAKDHPHSCAPMPIEQGYALFLRGLPVPDEVSIEDAGRKYIIAKLLKSEAVKRDHSMRHLNVLARGLIDATGATNDYAAMRETGDAIARMDISLPDDFLARS